jgi:hypothetical protein
MASSNSWNCCTATRLTQQMVGLAAAQESSMCDFSLMHISSRPAQVGDKLVSTSFHASVSRGFAAVGEPNVAVCLMPGTEIAFDKDIRTDNLPTGEITNHHAAAQRELFTTTKIKS